MSDPQTMEETQPQVNENNAGSGEGGHDVAKNNLHNDNPRESSPDNDPRSESEDFQSASPEPESEGDDANAKPKGRPRRDKRGYNNARQRKRQKLMEEAAASSDITKWSIRQKVWDHLEKNDLVNFPRPVTHRIPNFKERSNVALAYLGLCCSAEQYEQESKQDSKRLAQSQGAAAAAEKAATLEVFKSAKTVKINPDKPQENCRFLTLEANKTLLVPTPRLRSGLFNKINPPDDCNKEMLRICATSQGVKEHSSPLGLDAEVKIDLVIVGSVAVSRQGYRIGKGEGFADLEFAMMATMGAVNADTIVVTTVHESQIMDIPEELLGEHDLTVDYIVTEDEIIECDSGRPKPTGIIWSLLDREKLNRVPVLKRLRKMESEAGKDVTVKDSTEVEVVDSAEEEREMDSRPRSDRGRRGRRGGRGGYTNTRPFRGGSGRGRRRGGRRGGMRDGPGRRQYDDDIPSVYVGGIPGSVRVSELKLKIREKEVNPLRVIWHGQNGHAFLQFQEPSAADEAIEALQNLEIVGKPLRVEMSRRSKPSGDADASGEAADVDDGPKHEADDNSRGNDNVEAQGKGDAGGDADHGLEVD